MLEAIALMLNDDELKKLIGSHIYPTQTDYLGDCVIYNFHTIYQDKKVQKCRLQINIIATTTAKTVAIEERIKTILLTLGDGPLTNDILQVELNGGGTLYDGAREKNHRILYFDIIKRGVLQWQ